MTKELFGRMVYIHLQTDIKGTIITSDICYSCDPEKKRAD